MALSLYKTAFLERMQNSSTIDGLISFILKPRDDECPRSISLWVAERIVERRLLNDDGIEMPEHLVRTVASFRHQRRKANPPGTRPGSARSL
jgi:hypothetical protein